MGVAFVVHGVPPYGEGTAGIKKAPISSPVFWLSTGAQWHSVSLFTVLFSLEVLPSLSPRDNCYIN
jgi:hypothetical protein